MLTSYKMAPSHPLRVPIMTMHINGASVGNISKTPSRVCTGGTLIGWHAFGRCSDWLCLAGVLASSNAAHLRDMYQERKWTKMYLEEVMEKTLVPWSTTIFKNKPFIFQQNSAPPHKSKIVQGWCGDKLPDFISPEEWPSYSPDLNVIDYSIWSYLETEVCPEKHRSVESLKKPSEVEGRNANGIRACHARAFPRRLKACTRARGSRFEI
ncbi:unnamed protein product [Heligmosomoides polygyrus]|uniref:Transposable element Tc1 transposase n=1 Tax=Heligmosomoides polygyrus TaxID=6339 RepID=A0A183FTI1_HELPZ|nr:unnamed protein product [Heligmosomoides polygyrus]